VNREYRCNGSECGDTDSGNIYGGVFDKDKWNFNSYIIGNASFLEPKLIINTEKWVSFVIQFVAKIEQTMVNCQKSWENMFKVENSLKQIC
jgi:hypothetical protein